MDFWLMVFSHFFAGYSFLVFFLDRFFSFGRQKVVAGRVRQAVVSYSNDCMVICLGGLSIDCLDECSSKRGCSLNRFDCNRVLLIIFINNDTFKFLKTTVIIQSFKLSYVFLLVWISYLLNQTAANNLWNWYDETKVYSGPCEVFKTELFAKIVLIEAISNLSNKARYGKSSYHTDPALEVLPNENIRKTLNSLKTTFLSKVLHDLKNNV